jgi:hypothetical protein
MTINQVNNLNTGLMIGALIAAFVLPFEVFLLSYAILGPLHYLTEMSWLHDRNYFMPRKWMAIPIAVLTLTSLFSSGYLPKEFNAALPGWLQPESLASWNAEAVFAALCLSLVFVIAKTARGRSIGLVLVVGGSLAAHYINFEIGGRSVGEVYIPVTIYDVFFTIFLTTIVHVFVFTGAFVLLGALRSNGRTGLISLVVFVLCAVACFALPVDAIPTLSQDTVTAYNNTSLILSHELVQFSTGERFTAFERAYTTPAGVMVARLIAFAYTYHYLNWFSKTSVIKWHEVPKTRLVAVVVIWIVSLVLYGMDYLLGLKWLLLLSMLHVFLEFPLNWQSLFGIKAELVKRLNPS